MHNCIETLDTGDLNIVERSTSLFCFIHALEKITIKTMLGVDL